MEAEGSGGTPLHFGPLTLDREHERKLAVFGVILTVLAVGLALYEKNKGASAVATPATTDAGAGGGGGTSSLDASTLAAMQLKVAEEQIAHSATYGFTSDINSISHAIGSTNQSQGGSGGLNLGLFSIGGGGGSNKVTTFDLTHNLDLAQSVGGSNLSESEFELLVQQGQAIINAGAAAQLANANAAANSLGYFVKPPK